MTSLSRISFLLAAAVVSSGVCLSAAAQAPAAPAHPHGMNDGATEWATQRLEASPRHHEYVTLKHDGRSVEAFVVYPEVKTKAPVIVLIHEIFGLTAWAKEMADELAGAGYIVIAPDLLSGLSGGAGTSGSKGTPSFPTQDAAVQAVSKLDAAQVLADLDAAADYAKKLPSADSKLFVTGFCWGGGNSFLFATHRKDLTAAFVFYGPPPPADAMKSIVAPVYGFYAGNDARITATLPQTKLDMKAAGKKYEPVVYDGAGHGFMRLGEAPDATAPNAAARMAGFHRIVDLLGGVH